jgi:protoporphyrinogen oxidase
LKKVLILGGGVSGLALEYYLKNAPGIEVCGLEREKYLGGHAHTWEENEVFWDEGPHIFFGSEETVSPFFDFSDCTEQEATVLNYADGVWINHPIYVNLYALPFDQKSRLVNSLSNAKAQTDLGESTSPENYLEWLFLNYGHDYSELFPIRYNKKYWRTDLMTMATDWIDNRMFKPSLEQIELGAKAPQHLHYIKRFKYPKKGGFSSFYLHAIKNSKFETESDILSINLEDKYVVTTRGKYFYDILVNTIPLPKFITLCANIPESVAKAGNSLKSTRLTLVNLKISGEVLPRFHWAYFHDEDLLSTRITNYSLLNKSISSTEEKSGSENEILTTTNLQVEVYESESLLNGLSTSEIVEQVIEELRKIGLIPTTALVTATAHTTEWANVIFDLERKPALEEIYMFLTKFGLPRGSNEFSANYPSNETPIRSNHNGLYLLGRFGQWNYYWTHDCVKKARDISLQIQNVEME